MKKRSLKKISALILSLAIIFSAFTVVPATVTASISTDDVIFNLDFTNYEANTPIVDTISGVTLKADGLDAGSSTDKNGVTKSGAHFTGDKTVNGIQWTSDLLDPMTNTEGGFTINTCMKFTDKQSATHYFAFVRNNVGTTRNCFISMVNGSNRNTLSENICYQINDSAHKLTAWAEDSKVYTNTWYMITVTQDPSDKKVKFYLNGELITTADNIAPETVYTIANEAKDTAVATYTVGGHGIWDDPVFNGYMQNFTMYGRALSASEIKKLSQGLSTSEDYAAHVDSLIDALPAAADVQLSNKTEIEAARAEYDSLSDSEKQLVTKLDKLVDAEEALAALLAGPQDAIDVVNMILALNPITYKSMPAITAAQAAYDALSDDSKTYVSNYADLVSSYTEYNNIIDSFTWSLATSRPGTNAKVTINSWAYTCSDDVWNATRAAFADAVKYQYTKGRQVDGNDSSGTDAWMTENHSFWHVGLEGSDDNYNKQGFRTKFTTAVSAFPGMAFTLDTTFAQNYGFEGAIPIGEYFMQDGKTYQVMWDGVRLYNSVEPSSSGTVPTVTTYGWHPDERLSASETGKNIFRFAYAKYSQDNRWNDLTLGVPQTDYASEAGNLRYQKYVGPQGTAYLLTTTDLIAAAPTDAAADTYSTDMAAAYYIVNGAIADAIAADADFYNKAGSLISVSDTEVKFVNATVTADGIVWNYADYTDVDAAIISIPADLTGYTDASVTALNEAVAAVVRGKLVSEQTVVDGYATAISSAISGLIEASVEMVIGISDGMVTEAETAGKYNITWNATIAAGDGTSIDDINAAGVKFKSYGVYYAASSETLDDYKNASAEDIRNKIINQGEDIAVYTMFGFRLKNVGENATRAAMFYLEYEYNNNSYIILSTVNETVAFIAE